MPQNRLTFGKRIKDPHGVYLYPLRTAQALPDDQETRRGLHTPLRLPFYLHIRSLNRNLSSLAPDLPGEPYNHLRRENRSRRYTSRRDQPDMLCSSRRGLGCRLLKHFG